jgi:hypothetical protein
MGNQQPDSLQQSLDAVLALRELIPEAHRAIKDLRATLKEFRKLEAGLPREVEAELGRIVAEGLSDYETKLEAAIATGTKAVQRRFDLLGALLLGEDPETVANAEHSIPELVDLIVEAQKTRSSPAAFLKRERLRLDLKGQS